jgi:hypothetical protein
VSAAGVEADEAGRDDDGWGAGEDCVARGAGALPAERGVAGFLVFGFAASVFGGKRSFSRRTTGGSMLDEGALTNSPICCKCSMSCLLDMPSSLATSNTRGFATMLLSRARAQDNWEQVV